MSMHTWGLASRGVWTTALLLCVAAIVTATCNQPEPTNIPLPTPTVAPSSTAEPTNTPAPTNTTSPPPTLAPSPLPASTPLPNPTSIPAATPVPTQTPTSVPTPTPTPVPTPTAVPTPTPSPTPTPTPTPSPTPTPTPTPVPTPTPTPVLTLSGTGDTIDSVTLGPGKYLVTASITDNCQGSDCNQQFAINMQSIFGDGRDDRDQTSVNRYLTKGYFTFQVKVGDNDIQTERRDLLEGKQLVNVTAEGPWSITFDFQGRDLTASASPTISGTGEALDFFYLDPGIYLATASITDNCEGSDCHQPFEIYMNSLYGSGFKLADLRGTEFVYLFRVEVNDKSFNSLDGELYKGKQILTVSAKGSWTITFDLQKHTPAPTASPTISGTGYTQDIVTLDPGRYIVTVSTSDKCEEPDCIQRFTIHMDNLSIGSRHSEYLYMTGGVSRFLLHVHDGSASLGDIYKGKQILTIVAQGPWTIHFDLRKPAPIPPTSLTISGNGNYSDIVTIGPGRYVVTESITDNCYDSTCDQHFGFTAQSVFGYDHSISTWRSVTEGSFALLLNVQSNSASRPWSHFYYAFGNEGRYGELYEGPQIFNVVGQGPWTITFSLQEPSPITATNPTISGIGNSFDIVNLEPGRYLVTASITDNCWNSICDQYFGVVLQSVFGNSPIAGGIESRQITEGTIPLLMTVGDSATKQLLTVTAQGPWTITFERQ